MKRVQCAHHEHAVMKRVECATYDEHLVWFESENSGTDVVEQLRQRGLDCSCQYYKRLGLTFASTRLENITHQHSPLAITTADGAEH